MKKLYLIRHAKASWENTEQADFDRPLTAVGETDAHSIAQQLKEQKVKPDLIISSTAPRALKTAEIFAEELGYSAKKITTDEHIYTGGVEELVKLIKTLPTKNKTVFLVGHNPTLTLVAHYLSEGLRLNIATCGVLAIGFNMTEWQDIVETEGKFLSYVHPHHDLHEHKDSHDQSSGSSSEGF